MRVRSVIFAIMMAKSDKLPGTRQVVVMAVENCLASAVAGCIDLLHAANLAGRHQSADSPDLFAWRVVSIDGKPVTTGNGSLQAVDCGIRQAAAADVVVLPGSTVLDERALLALLDRHRPLLAWLRERAAHNALLASSCTGSFLLAEAGLLTGRRATTAWPFTSLFARRYPDIELCADERLVDNGAVLCSGSATSYQDLMLAIIRRLAGPTTAALVARYMLVELHRASQAAFRVPLQHGYDDPLVRAAVEYIRRNLHATLSIETLADRLHVSSRTLSRRFRSATGDNPGGFVQKQRIESARRLLEVSALPLDDIVQRIGYSDISAFRRLFRRSTGLTPGDYRERFGIRP